VALREKRVLREISRIEYYFLKKKGDIISPF
jgi:hypothetical protein